MDNCHSVPELRDLVKEIEQMLGSDYDVEQAKIDVARAKIENKATRKVEVARSDVVEVESSADIDILYN